MSKQPTATCKRCGKLFVPTLRFGKRLSTCCDNCSFRNLMDGLGMPTPPELLDKHTKVPTLSDEEYRRKLKDTPEDGYE